MKANNSLGLYIHIPYCLHKCPYCDFFSTAIISGPSAHGTACFRDCIPPDFISSLVREIESRRADFSGCVLESVYLGGGTPSLLSGSQFAGLMESVKTVFELSADCEISLEANPGTLQQANLEQYLEAGLNRLSLGVQSFTDTELQTLGRIHDAAANHAAIKMIKETGPNNFSLDLIIGIPGQTSASLDYNLEQLLAAASQHVSAYILQVESSTPMGRQIAAGQLLLPDDEEIASMYYQALDALSGAGFRQYEISNYARPGCECRHNLRYWQAQDYLGVGPGAVSLVNGARLRNNTPLTSYLKGALSIEELESMDAPQQAVDALILALRCLPGVDLAAFQARFGWDLSTRFHNEIEILEQAGLLESRNGNLSLTRQGLILSNQVFMAFLP